MNYRNVTLLAYKEYSADYTEVIDLNGYDPISSIVISHAAIGTQDAHTAHPIACLKKIEIIDGSNVLWSADGYEAEGVDWYSNGGKTRLNVNFALNTMACTRYVGLNFGRFLWDPLYGFVPAKYKNPQLRITLDINAGGGAPTQNNLIVYGNVFDGKVPSMVGFISLKEIKQYSVTSGVIEYTDLPTDHILRNLYIRAAKAGTEPTACLSNFKLSEDNDKKIPFDVDFATIARCIGQDYGFINEEYFYQCSSTDRYLYIMATLAVTAQGCNWAATAAARYGAFYNGDGGRLDCNSPGGVSNMQISVKGYIPHAVYQIPFGRQMEPDDWYNVPGLNKLQAQITGASTTAVGHILVEQIRTD